MIHEIAGADDPRIAPYARVGDHAWLLAQGLFVAEGRLVVERVVETGEYFVHSALLTPPAFEALRRRLEPLAADVYVASQAVLNAVTGFNFHRGCVALVRRPAHPPVETFLNATRLLILEGVGNPDNVGGLFRVAAALHADGILLDERSADPLYRKAVRTSMGAVLRVPWTRLENWPAVLRTFRTDGWRIVALTPEASAPILADVAGGSTTEGRVALLLGSEGGGLTEAALDAAGERARIPIAGGIDSLNVVVAAAIALYAFGSSA